MTTPWEERQIIQGVVDGLNAAIAANPSSWDYDELDPIKLNKLLFIAVDHFDLDITYRWFKYGSDFTKHPPVSVTSIYPTAINDLASPDKPRLADSVDEDDEISPTPRDYKHFFEREADGIERIFTDNTREYLRSFYTDYAPSELQELYAECAVLQTSLDEIIDADNPGSLIYERTDELLNEITAVKQKVKKTDFLKNQAKPFGRFSRLFKDVIVTVESREGEITNRQNQVIDDLVYFFYENAWLLVSLKIASRHTHGPNADNWIKGANVRLAELEESFSTDMYSIYRQCVEADLIGNELLKFWKRTLSEEEHRPTLPVEERAFDEWRGSSQEANRQL